jgi:hypothetical protein
MQKAVAGAGGAGEGVCRGFGARWHVFPPLGSLHMRGVAGGKLCIAGPHVRGRAGSELYPTAAGFRPYGHGARRDQRLGRWALRARQLRLGKNSQTVNYLSAATPGHWAGSTTPPQPPGSFLGSPPSPRPAPPRLFPPHPRPARPHAPSSPGNGKSGAPDVRPLSEGWCVDDHLFRDMPSAVELILRETGAEQLHWIGAQGEGEGQGEGAGNCRALIIGAQERGTDKGSGEN